ncbi:MAG: RecX family transcriptional regulator, partial [Clostridia bacterium]|nr:RecX family transcriptional regulator [Clostridia bacterium]
YINSVHGKGKRAIEADLIKRKASREAISAVLEEFDESAGDAFEILQKYMRGKEISKPNLLKGYKYLLSKGFSYDTAQSATEKFKEGLSDL